VLVGRGEYGIDRALVRCLCGVGLSSVGRIRASVASVLGIGCRWGCILVGTTAIEQTLKMGMVGIYSTLSLSLLLLLCLIDEYYWYVANSA
jgi:hypothetical protein